MSKFTAVDISEIVAPPRQRDRSFYVALFAVVLPLWSVVPLSWLSVIWALRTGAIWSFGWRGKAWFAACLCEVFFSVYYFHKCKFISGPSPMPAGNVDDLRNTLDRLFKAGLANLSADDYDEENLHDERPGSPAETIEQLKFDDPRAVDFRNHTRIWFGRVPWSALRSHEIHSWIYWSLYNKPMPEDVLPERQAEVDHTFDLIQKRSGAIIPKGSNPAVKPLLLTLDKVNVTIWRPFGWYALVGFSTWVLKQYWTRNWNVKFGTYNGMSYLLHVPQGWNSVTGPRPIVFWHGLGLGLVQYKQLISKLLHDLPDYPLLVPIQPHVSQHFFHSRFLTPMGRHETVESLAGLLEHLRWVPLRKDFTSESESSQSETEGQLQSVSKQRKGVTMLSHSNGSYVHAWMLKAYPKMITRSCFVDPVTFCSWEGDVCYNFVYRPCRTGIELIMRYFVATELGVANLLQRHFDWSSNALWYEEIPNARDPTKTLFVLGAKDEILNAARVEKYLKSHGVKKNIWINPRGHHGQALSARSRGHKLIFQWLGEKSIET